MYLPQPLLEMQKLKASDGLLGKTVYFPFFNVHHQLNAYSGNDGKPGIESTNIMFDLCWYDVDDYLDKNPAEYKTPLFFQDFSKISGPWTDRGHPVERTYWHVERTYWHVERTYRHVDTVTNKNGATFRIYSAQSPDQTFSTAPKNWTKMENGRCGLLVALCWRY